MSQGKPTANIVWRVPTADEASVDDFWKSYEAWMQKSHTFGIAGDDIDAPRLLKFYIAKGKELKNPMDPSEGETGNLYYILSETYFAPSGVMSHMEKGGMDWPGMMELSSMNEKYLVFMEAGNCTTFASLQDELKVDVTAVGQPCGTIVWSVPAAAADEANAYVRSPRLSAPPPCGP